jgi:PAS domain S-box-containing protein
LKYIEVIREFAMGQVNNESSTVQAPAETTGDFTRFSPVRFLIITIGGIFLAEVIAMLLLLYFKDLPYYLQTLMDATIMIILIFPVVYYFSLRPLLLHIGKRQEAEKSLHKAYDELELRVQARTEELKIANSDLEEEIAVRGRTEDALRKSEQRLSRAQEIAHLGSWELDLLADQLTWSDEVYRIFGWQPQEFGATYKAFLETVHPDDRAAVDEAHSCSIREGRDMYEMEYRIARRLSREVRTIHQKCELFRDDNGQTVRSVGMLHDITERKKAERELQQLNRTLQAHTASNKAVLRATNETELLEEVCKIVVEVCGHAMIWIGYAEDDGEKSVRPVANAGFEEGYLDTLQITWADTERGRGPTGTAIRTGKPSSCSHMLTDPQFAPWREQALQRGYASSIALPLISDVRVFGAMTIYSRQPESFSPDEEKLLTDLASDLAHGIEMIRLREAHERTAMALRLAHDELELRVQERTEELAIANEELLNEIGERKRIEQHLRIQTTAMAAAANGMVITDRQGNIEWTNPALSQMSGYESNEMIGQGMRLFQSGKHVPGFYSQLWQTILAGNVWQGETTNRRKDGSLYVEEQTITPVLDGNAQISHFIAIKQDITERKLVYAQLEESNRELTSLSILERQQRKVAETLSQASVALSQTLDIQHVMETILDYVQHVLPIDTAFLILSEGNDHYRIRCIRASEEQNPVLNLLNQPIDLLNEPVLKPFFEKHTSTLIRDSGELAGWSPPPELAALCNWLVIPLISTGKTMGMVVAAHVQANFFSQDQVELAEAVVSQAAVAMQNAWLFEQVRAGRQRLQLLSRHLVEIQENERKYIARELHDETSQALTSLKMGLHAIEQSANVQSTIVQQVAELKTLADGILESLHRLAMNLRPASLDHLGLVEALTSLVQSTGERSGITARYKSLGVDQRNRLTEDMESSIYRIVQESLTNIVRHARATYADVILEWQDDKIIVIVEDDGVGLDLSAARTRGHLGLVGMQERAEMLGGKLLIDSIPNGGTTLVVEIPYAN